MTAPGMFGAGMLGLGLPIPVIGNPISSAAGSVASGVLGFGAQGIMGTLTQWVAGGAVWFLDRLGGAMGATTSPDLGARWFTTHFHLMATIAAMVALPVALVSIIQAIARQDSSILIRCLLVNLPLALLATGVVAEAIQFAIGLTDQLCNAVSSGAGNQMKSLFTSMEQWLLSPTANFAGPGVPAFVMFILAGVVAFGALVLWIEMILRSAAVYVAVLFLPLVLIGIVSPVSAPWCKRAMETIGALIVSKLVIVATLSLAVSAMASKGQASGSSVVVGCSMLLLSAFSPFALLKLIPMVEAGAIHHLEGMSRRGLSAVGAPARLAISGANAASTGIGLVMNMRAASSPAAAGLYSSSGSRAQGGVGGSRRASNPTSGGSGPDESGGTIMLDRGDRGNPALERKLDGRDRR